MNFPRTAILIFYYILLSKLINWSCQHLLQEEMVLENSVLVESEPSVKEWYEVHLEPAMPRLHAVDEKFLSAARKCVEENMDNFNFNATMLANAMAISRMQLHRKLRSLIGLSTSHYIRALRLRRARQLLLQGGFSITEVAYAVGFNELAYFSKCFKAEFGQTPSSFSRSSGANGHSLA